MAELTKRGGSALTDEQLKALVVGKALWVRNTVTGEPFEVRYDTTGYSILLYLSRGATVPSEFGDPARASYLMVPSPYSIQNGKLMSALAGTPFEVTIYKAGNTYYAARSNEFGFANYEILPKGPPNMVNLGRGESPGEDQSEYLRVPE